MKIIKTQLAQLENEKKELATITQIENFLMDYLNNLNCHHSSHAQK